MSLMNVILCLTAGYVVHDAVQQTVVGEVLDKIALPADLFVTKSETPEETDKDAQISV